VTEEQVSLRDYFERNLEQMDRRYQQRFESQERAVQEYKSASDVRLGGMNEFRSALADAQAKYITRSEAMAMVLAACAVTGAIIELANFLLRK